MPTEHHLTQAAFDRLKAEHEDLTTRGRIDIARQIERARELGDLSENGDYHAAKDAQGMMEGRIRQLESILKDARIVEKQDDVIGPGTVVTIVYDGDDDDMAESYLIGHIEERHEGLDGVITPGSPLGRALMGKAAGDSAEYESNGKPLKVRITGVRAH